MPLHPTDVGGRVVVRRRLPDPSPGARFTDVLGELVELGAEQLTVRRRDGELITVALREVAAARAIPPSPPPRSVLIGELEGQIGELEGQIGELEGQTGELGGQIRELERIAALGWRGLDEQSLGDWRLRAAGGFTGRANSVLPLGEPDRPLPAAWDEVVRWYAERGLPARFQVPLPLAVDLDNALAEAGWRAYHPTTVLVADLVDVVARCPERPNLPPVGHSARPDASWLAGYNYRGRPLPDGAVDVLTNAADPVFAAAGHGDGLLGVARGVVDEGWLGVTAVTVQPAARRRGVARHLMAGLARWGQARGAGSVYLQVAEDNEAAQALYAGLGFLTHHRYRYRIGPT